jgi:hypothetical protein
MFHCKRKAKRQRSGGGCASPTRSPTVTSIMAINTMAPHFGRAKNHHGRARPEHRLLRIRASTHLPLPPPHAHARSHICHHVHTHIHTSTTPTTTCTSTSTSTITTAIIATITPSPSPPPPPPQLPQPPQPPRPPAPHALQLSQDQRPPLGRHRTHSLRLTLSLRSSSVSSASRLYLCKR